MRRGHYKIPRFKLAAFLGMADCNTSDAVGFMSMNPVISM